MYNLRDSSEIWRCKPKHSPFISPSPARQWLVALSSFPPQDALVGDPVLTVRSFFRYLIYVSRSNVTVMMYTRAAASDYDDWESVYDNPGWGSKHLIPLLKKVFFIPPLTYTNF
jgi:hypothetical protein